MADGMIDGTMMDENGNRIMGIGPLVTVIPKHFHRYLSKETLKSYLACNQVYGNKLLQNSSPADIPVIVREYRDTIFPEVLTKLNDLGKRAVSELHPWIVCTLIDVDEFDKFIIEDVEGSISNTQQVESGSEYHTHVTREVVKPQFEMQSENTNTLDPCNTEVMPLKVTDSTSTKGTDNPWTSTDSLKWSKEKVHALIHLHQQHESMFTKPSVKKKHVWSLIAAELHSDQFNASAGQAEQKWKNITKSFRDAVDHNNKSGNAPKKCPYFDELQESYGYRPNVKPIFTGSAGSSNEFITTQTSSNSTESFISEHLDTSSEDRQVAKKMKTKQNKNEVVSNLLKEMKSEMIAEQKILLDTLSKQHQDRMEHERKKLELIAELVKAVKK